MTLIKETIFHPPQLRRLRPILITISAHNNGGKSKRKGKRDEPQLLELTRTEPFLSCSVRWSGRRSTLRAWHYILSSALHQHALYLLALITMICCSSHSAECKLRSGVRRE